MPVVVDGKATAETVKGEVAETVAHITRESGVQPGLAVVLVGDDPASSTYVRWKGLDCIQVGIKAFDYHLPADTQQEQLNDLVDQLNANPDVHGILVQLPLPKHLDEEQVIARIAPVKDVDGFHPENLGRLVRGLPAPRACTPWGVIRLLDQYGIDIEGKHAVVVGRSNIVGKPQSLMLLERNATVTICHSRTADLPAVCRTADILVAAVGRPLMITPEYVKEGAVIMDVGINKYGDRLVGDVDYDAVAPLTAAITPVPGGVGPMTRAMLMQNTAEAAALQLGVAL